MAEVRTKIPIEQSLLLIWQGGACKELAGITAYTVLDEDTGENDDEHVDWSHLNWEAKISLKIWRKNSSLTSQTYFAVFAWLVIWQLRDVKNAKQQNQIEP